MEFKWKASVIGIATKRFSFLPSFFSHGTTDDFVKSISGWSGVFLELLFVTIVVAPLQHKTRHDFVWIISGWSGVSFFGIAWHWYLFSKGKTTLGIDARHAGGKLEKSISCFFFFESSSLLPPSFTPKYSN